ncbi:MAG: putative helicase [Pseudonocardiales bacterium]|nr:putative helicase [Pseudonocardiales bacterium]
MASPAQKYAEARDRSSYPQLTEFRGGFAFDLDEFQVEGCRSLERGSSVLVCAPTGSGKTVVGEFAVHLALTSSKKCFYTTPIKALSNQKFRDLGERFGRENVGLLTGDTVINASAPILVMTTEVLRNMLYAGSSSLQNLRYVVMDEVHYLGDRFRGAVWEEVIIHLPESVQIAALSATVSNAEEFGEWLATVRGDTDVVLHEERPVPLWQHMLVGTRMFDLFNDPSTNTIDPALQRYINERVLRSDPTSYSRGRSRNQGGGNRPRGWRPPVYSDVVERLDREGLLPTIVFIFSRAGCDAAVRQCLGAGLTLTKNHERDEIRRVAETRTSDLSEEDLAALGYWDWLEALQRGVASHHAGLIPVFKETVEELFTRGLVRAVFATETLALGINMPARTVVLDRLRKFNGDTHVDVTPGEYTQLTGRAGRRGLDIEGHAVVVWGPQIDPTQVAGLASTRTYPLKSSFRPSYNMAVNLISSVGRPAARELLESSFAQFQADRSVVGLVRQIRSLESSIADESQKMTCHLGDFEEYAELRRRLKDVESEQARSGRAQRKAQGAIALEQLRRGDVVAVTSGRRAGWAVVIEPTQANQSEPRILVVTEDRWSGRLSLADFPEPPEAVGTVRIPKQFDHRAPHDRRDLASSVRALNLGPMVTSRRRNQVATEDSRLVDLRSAIRHHPCHACADRELHARVAERVHRLRRELDGQRTRVEGRTNTLARTFDRICALLADRGFLHVRGTGVDAATDVTDSGRTLTRIWGESDLLTALCLRSGVWTGLTAPDLAAAVSCLVYESRRDEESEPRIGSPALRDALTATQRMWAELIEAETAHGLPLTREPDLGFVTAVHRWAGGQSLARALQTSAGEPRTAGDFVRWCRQVIDLLDQIAQAGAGSDLARIAREATHSIRRGVVLS